MFRQQYFRYGCSNTSQEVFAETRDLAAIKDFRKNGSSNHSCNFLNTQGKCFSLLKQLFLSAALSSGNGILLTAISNGSP